VDYPCAKFCDFSFSRFDFIVRTDRQTDRITDTQNQYKCADDRYTDATAVGVSKYLTCDQKLTESKFSLPHVAYQTKRIMGKTKRKPLNGPESVKAVRWEGWDLQFG